MGLRLPPKARSAQNRRATGRLKRNRCGRSTFGTIRLSFGAYPYLGASLGLAFLAAFWVVFELFFNEEKLLSGCENELGVAINALQNPVRKFHGLLSAASEIPECRVRVKFHSAQMVVGKYVSSLTASQPRLYRVADYTSVVGRVPACRSPWRRTLGAPGNWSPASPRRSSRCRCSVQIGAYLRRISEGGWNSTRLPRESPASCPSRHPSARASVSASMFMVVVFTHPQIKFDVLAHLSFCYVV
jgi:hypothetical protein